MTLHASLEKREDVSVVRVGLEGQSSAVVHELLELGRLVHAEILNGDLLLLALNVVVFFIFGASWQALPR